MSRIDREDVVGLFAGAGGASTVSYTSPKDRRLRRACLRPDGSRPRAKESMHLHVRQKREIDAQWIRELLVERWRDTTIVSRGRRHGADSLPALVCTAHEQPVGLLTYHLSDAPDGTSCEIVTLDAVPERHGIGSTLVEALRRRATQRGWKRIWSITTNDNRPAQSFFQKNRFRLCAIHPDAVRESRRLKPLIPSHGHGGNPIADELEYELCLER